MQRNIEPMKRQVEEWQGCQLSVIVAKLVVYYHAFVEGELEAPNHLARKMDDLHSQHPAFGVRTENDVEPVERIHLGVQQLEPIPQFRATAELGEFLQKVEG